MTHVKNTSNAFKEFEKWSVILITYKKAKK